MTAPTIDTAEGLLALLQAAPGRRFVDVAEFHPDEPLYPPAVIDGGEIVAWLRIEGSAADLLRAAAHPNASGLPVRFFAGRSWALPDYIAKHQPQEPI